MIQTFSIMIFLGAFSFLSFGLCSANSIEAKKSKIAEKVLLTLMVLGLLSFVIGVGGLFYLNEV